MGNLSLTLIIPTYNRRDTLKKCLNAVFNQTYPKTDYEVIVIDDGSTDGTEELINSLLNDLPRALRYFKQENKGPAAARNVGIKNAYGKIILFIGDDIIATPTLLNEHNKWHKDYPDDNVAVLGYVTWSPEIKVTPFMQWLENGGPQFSFWQIKDKIDIDWNYFYTSNVSIKRAFLLKNNGFFDEEFHYAAYEDNELGYRLMEKGMVLKYNKSAIAYHYHYTSVKDACLRMIKVGASQPIFVKKIGEGDKEINNISKFYIKNIFRGIKFISYYFLAKFYEKRQIKEKVFSYIMGYCTNIGVRKYYKRKPLVSKLTGTSEEKRC